MIIIVLFITITPVNTSYCAKHNVMSHAHARTRLDSGIRVEVKHCPAGAAQPVHVDPPRGRRAVAGRIRYAVGKIVPARTRQVHEPCMVFSRPADHSTGRQAPAE